MRAESESFHSSPFLVHSEKRPGPAVGIGEGPDIVGQFSHSFSFLATFREKDDGAWPEFVQSLRDLFVQDFYGVCNGLGLRRIDNAGLQFPIAQINAELLSDHFP